MNCAWWNSRPLFFLWDSIAVFWPVELVFWSPIFFKLWNFNLRMERNVNNLRKQGAMGIRDGGGILRRRLLFC